MSKDSYKPWQDDGDVVTDRRRATKKPPQFKVILHNDNYTTMEFVVFVLVRHFHKSETEANHVMLTVHHRGKGIAGIYSKDVADTKVHEVTAFALEKGMPLRLSVEST